MSSSPLDRACEAVEAYVRCGRQVRYTRDEVRAASGSQALNELGRSMAQYAGCFAVDPIDAAIGLAAAYMEAAEDHLAGLARVARPPQLASSPCTVARGFFEAAARCWHLLDPAATIEQRAGRALNERLYGVREKAKDSAADAAHSTKREAELIVGAKKAGLPSTKRGDWIVSGRMDNTRLVDGLLDTLPKQGQGSVYRSLTAIAHSSLGGIASILVANEEDPGGGRLELSDQEIFDVIKACVLTYEVIMDRAFAYLGWDPSTWDSWKAEGRKRLVEAQSSLTGRRPTNGAP